MKWVYNHIIFFYSNNVPVNTGKYKTEVTEKLKSPKVLTLQ